MRVTETYIGTVTGAIVGLAQWLIVTYGFPGTTEPVPVATAVYVCLPALLGFAFAFFTRRTSKLASRPQDDPVSQVSSQ